MIFEALWGSAQRGELLLTDGGYCRWHLRRDKWLTILEIIATRKGEGWRMLDKVAYQGMRKGAVGIIAKCPADLPSNGWWAKMGFIVDRVEETKSGRKVNVWVRRLSSTAPRATPLSVVSPPPPGG